ncbi:hypothetical protein G3A_06765 [Bacillus sp. 17376]|uniref:Thiamine pyrophosphate-requiring enzymes n=1 Tax=Mesobacillus boroniphilus JCM 21738 TaxID=1294265 RepID=W4RKW4_9BACI|nr:thiamine pyrophosphate-binding protein [Mesobacillus boroniphilus]ESU33378.1 hypothetical protein G3A_06765 [Bacillus sp. 17376]GAE44792.1 thiamine pyrophosphate-requiring enzymes [Mesobacillus boroniphilus JCM 21738]
MKAAELMIKCLEREGVEYIFGVPGEENLDIMDALLDSSIEFIVTDMKRMPLLWPGHTEG